MARRQSVLASLGFDHIVKYHERWNIIDAPADYPLP